MGEHAIRLRGGWEWLEVPHADGSNVAQPASLPLTWPSPLPPRVRLTRRFGAPRIDESKESLWLRLEHVGGLESIRLNGQSLDFDRDARRLEILLDARAPLLSRNQLELEAIPQEQGDGSSEPWGNVALVVQPR